MASGSQNMTTFKAKGLTSIANAVDTSNFIFLKSTTLTADQLGNTVSLSLNAVGVTGAAMTNHSLFLNAGIGSGLGTPFQLQIPDSSHLYIYKRWYTSGAWSGWSKVSAGTADTWTTARTLTIGATGKSVNGSANVSWSMNEIMGSSDSTKFYRGDKTWASRLTGGLDAAYLGVTNTSSTNGYGISLYNGATAGAPTYGIMFAGTGTFGTHGAVTSDWATYFTMSDTTNRGWIFRRGSTNVASIDGTGKLYLGYAANANNPGIYWNPYVESASDASDVSRIIQVKSGVAGGTELQIYQANDAADVINLVTPAYIYMNSKRAFTVNDSWLRINENAGFSSGTYFGATTVRTDGTLQVGSSGANFYANSSGDGKFSRDLVVGRYLTVTSTASSWLDGQRYTRAIRMSNSTDTGSYWPWIAQTNTGSAKWFSLGVLNNSFYIMGSTTSRTANSYDYCWRFDVSNGYLYGNFSGSLSGNASSASAVAWSGVSNKPTQWDASTAATLSAGLPTPRSTGHAYLCGNGLFISGPYTSNDCGWIRCTSSSESDFVMEIATGDDGGAGENIWVRLYNTSNAIAYQAKLLGTNGTSGYLRANGWWSSGSGQNVNNALGMTFVYADHGAPNSWGVCATFDYDPGGNSNYKTQFHVAGYYCVPYVRSRSSDRGGWTGWKQMWCAGDAVTNAVWNDLAEYRKSYLHEPGYAITPAGERTTKRLEPGCRITSDTWGFALGNESNKEKMPVAISGRVLAYPYRSRNEYHLGDCVCSAPGGKIDIMTRQEIREWPDCIIGIVNEIPEYDEWGPDQVDYDGRDKVKVNGRIWIDIK